MAAPCVRQAIVGPLSGTAPRRADPAPPGVISGAIANERQSHSHVRSVRPGPAAPMRTSTTQLLNELPDGARAIVARVVSASAEVDAVALRRLGELGFIPGEPVQLLRRGPGGREPIAVLIGETMFALRLLEAQCIEVQA
jgi:ferrous iron transport protein A